MRSILAGAAAAMLACLAPAAPAAAQASDKAEPATIDIVFNPPLDAPLRYRVVRDRAAREGRPAAVANWIEELRFAKAGDGFIAYWRMDPASLPAEMRAPAVAPMVAPFTGEPIAFELDGEGTVLRAHDWPETRARITTAVEGAGKLLPADAAQVMPRIRAMFGALTAETAPSVLLRNLDPLFGSGGLSAAIGETMHAPVEQPVPLLAGTVTMNVDVTLTAAEPGRTATLVSRSEIDPESLKQLMARMVDRFGASKDGEKLKREFAEKMPEMLVADVGTTLIDLPSGMPLRFESRRTAKLDGKEIPVETLTLTWLR